MLAPQAFSNLGYESVVFPSTTIKHSGSRQIQIGGVSIRISAERHSDLIFGSMLERFSRDSVVCDLDLRVQWVEKLPNTRGLKLFDCGVLWSVFELDEVLQFDFCTATLGPLPYKRLLIDRQLRFATILMSIDAFARCDRHADPMEYPLDELLLTHRLTREHAIEIHSTGIVRTNGDANLFVGHSGAGKSTTTRLWTDVEDVEVLSDDRIIVRRDEGRPAAQIPGDDPASASKHEVLRLRDCSASPTNLSAQDDKQIPRFARNDKKMRMYGTPWHGEAMFASPNSAPLTRIFVLEHGHGNVITPLSPSQAVAELFARSFVPFHRHEYVDSALVFLEELANSVPVYRYSFEPDQRAVDRIRQFRD